MQLRRTGFVALVIGFVACIAMSTSPAEAAPSPEPSEDGVAQHGSTKCSGAKHACGINGVYVCCDPDTECCKRKHGRTVCERKKNEKC